MTEYDSIAGKVIESLVSDMGLFFYTGYSLAGALQSTVAADPDTDARTLSVQHKQFDRLTRQARFLGDSNLVIWSPLLRSDEDRDVFEAYVTEQEKL